MSYRYSENMTYEFILNRMLGRVPDGVDKREGSIIYDALAPAAAELAQCYMELDVVMDETFVDTASLQYLMLRCKERGIAIRPETAAVVEGKFTPDTLEIPEGTRFNCGDLNFALTEKISPGIYLLECETLGTAGNLYSGQLLPVEVVDGLWTAQIIGVSVAGDDGDLLSGLHDLPQPGGADGLGQSPPDLRLSGEVQRHLVGVEDAQKVFLRNLNLLSPRAESETQLHSLTSSPKRPWPAPRCERR